MTFKSSTGKASWKGYSGAKVYFAAVDASIVAVNGKKADFKDIIDGLYLSGSIKKKSSYEIAIAAYTAGSTKLLAAWTTKFTYTPAPNIKRANLAKIVNQEYTGKKLKPTLNMTIGIVSLKKNKHYKVKFKNNKKIGKATVTITGKGLVKGKLKKTFKIVPKALIDEGNDFNQNPIGSGPYVFQSYTLGDRIEFEAFEDYFREGHKAQIKHMTWRIIPEGSSRTIALESGEGGDLYEKSLRQRAAVCLRSEGGGGLYACALILYLLKGERQYEAQMARTFLL